MVLTGDGPREFFKYDVTAQNADRRGDDRAPPQLLPKRLMRVVVSELLLQNEPVLKCVRVVHDGMVGLYSPMRLGDWQAKTFPRVKLSPQSGNGRGGCFDVTLKLVESIDVTHLRARRVATMAPQQAIQALDVVLRHLGSQRCTAIGSSLFSYKKPMPLDRTKELNAGRYQSVRRGLFLNMDTVASVFYAPGPLLDLLREVARVRGVEELVACRARWASAVQRLSVRVTHRPTAPAQTIREVGEQDAAHTMVSPRHRRDGDEDIAPVSFSVAEYFHAKYQIRLRFPQLPVVNVGSTRRPTWLPIEVCEVAVGQRCTSMENVDTAAIIKHTCVKPDQRKRAIEDGLRDAASDPFREAFGVEISSRMERVAAKTLQPPELDVKDHVVRPAHGAWNLSQHKYYRARRLYTWYVVNLSSSSSPQAVERFIVRLIGELQRCGIDVRDHQPVIIGGSSRDRDRGIESLMRDGYERAMRRTGGEYLDLVVVIKERQGPDYAEIKRVSDAMLGVPSQCLLAKNVARANGQYLGNVALKINLKLRGINFALARPLRVLSRSTTIVFGADVEYARSRHVPAIAAVVASMDASAASFVGRAAAQDATWVASVLPTIVLELLVKFEERAGARPDRIIYFRGGTSEGQMDDVFQAEAKAIDDAWAMLAGPHATTPPVTFVVVTRNHHVRAFPCSRGDADRSGNPPAGTVIDRTVVDPERFEFYLYGHSGLLGTSRPAHYTVLLNENELGESEMEQLCYDLCHMFGRSTRSVSVVAPVYYAKLFAARARFLLGSRLSTSLDAMSTDSDNSSSDHSGLHADPVIDIHRLVRNSLFFV
jgi:eukaryotic translation initiation factor 2C